MKLESIIPFVDSLAEIGEGLTASKPVRGELSVMHELVTKCPVNIVVGVTGDVEGMSLFGLTRETTMALAELMLGKELRVFDNSVSDVLIQFGQRVSDRCSSKLVDQGKTVKMLAPIIIRGQNIVVPTKELPTLIIPLDFEKIGTIRVKVSVTENQKIQTA